MHTVTLPAYTVGAGACSKLGEICALFGKKLFFIGGEKAYAAAFCQLYASVLAHKLTLAGKELFGDDCTQQNIDALAQKAQAAGAEVIVGVGGGKALDTAKGVAFQAKLPVVTVPTIAATCAAVTALSVVYRPDGSFERFYYYDRPADHAIIDTNIIAKAPSIYLRAGMGDTLAKYYEPTFSARNDMSGLDHSTALALTIAKMCIDPIFTYGEQAMADCAAKTASFALEQAVLAVIVSTGLVSILVKDCYNCAMAHALFYGLALLPQFEQNNLHGDAVAYGILVQLMVDQNPAEAKRLRQLLLNLGCPTCLADLQLCCDRKLLEPCLQDAIAGPDMETLPYQVNTDQLWAGILAVEKLALKQED